MSPRYPGFGDPSHGIPSPERRTQETQALLSEISAYCRDAKVAETTFGRLAVNDGKLVSRLRNGSKVTTDTLQRVRSYIGRHASEPATEAHLLPVVVEPAYRATVAGDTDRNFRFFDAALAVFGVGTGSTYAGQSN